MHVLVEHYIAHLLVHVSLREFGAKLRGAFAAYLVFVDDLEVDVCRGDMEHTETSKQDVLLRDERDRIEGFVVADV